MRPSDPRPPLSEWDLGDVVEELCVALRDVGVHDSRGDLSDRSKKAIERVRSADSELRSRGVEVGQRLALLSEETGWRMKDLLDECRAYPEIRPRLRQKDGVRRALRCHGCSENERPESDERYFLCDGCLRKVAHAIGEKRPMPALLLLRTYTLEARCRHADDDTVLAVYPWYGMNDDVGPGFCGQCIADELRRRGARAPD
jgi:hypothetical protein